MHKLDFTDSFNRKRAIIDSLGSLIIRVFGAFSTFLLYYFIANTITIEDAGYFFIVLSITTILCSIATLGMPTAILRFSGSYFSKKEWESIRGLSNFSIRRTICLSFVLISISYVICFVLEYYGIIKRGYSEVFYFLVWSIPFIGIINLIAASFQAIQKPLFAVLFRNVLIQVTACLIIFIFMYGYPEIEEVHIPSIYVLSSCLICVIAYYIFRHNSIKNVTGRYELKDKNSFIVLSNSLIYPSLIGIIIQHIGVITVGFFGTPEEAALFSISQRISLLTTFILIAVNLIAAPKFAAAFEAGKLQNLKQMSIFFNRIVLISALPFFFIILIFPSFILGLISEEYIAGSILLQILMIGQLINVGTGSVNYLLNMTGNEKSVKKIALLAGLLVLLLCPIFAIFFGVIGVAIAISLVISIQNLSAAVMVKRKLGFNVIG